MTREELLTDLSAYAAGLDAELSLLRQIQQLSDVQHTATDAADPERVGQVADERERLMAGLLKIEHEIRETRHRLADQQGARRGTARFRGSGPGASAAATWSPGSGVGPGNDAGIARRGSGASRRIAGDRRRGSHTGRLSPRRRPCPQQSIPSEPPRLIPRRGGVCYAASAGSCTAPSVEEARRFPETGGAHTTPGRQHSPRPPSGSDPRRQQPRPRELPHAAARLRGPAADAADPRQSARCGPWRARGGSSAQGRPGASRRSGPGTGRQKLDRRVEPADTLACARVVRRSAPTLPAARPARSGGPGDALVSAASNRTAGRQVSVLAATWRWRAPAAADALRRVQALREIERMAHREPLPRQRVGDAVQSGK